MKVTVIPLVPCVLGTIPKSLVKGQEDLEIRGPVETIHTTALLRFYQNTEKSAKLGGVGDKTRHDGVDKMIHMELCKIFKFENTNKWHRYNPESLLENGMKTIP